MKYKPFGEGLGLSGDRAGERISKRFTTSIPTDSWYVKIWVETGAVGLTLYLSMIFLSIGWGGWIIAMRLRDPELKGLLTGLLCGIFGMFINAYGNSFWGQFPTMVISFTELTFIIVGPYLDQEIQEKKSTDSNIKHHDWAILSNRRKLDRQGGVSISIDRRHRIPMFYGMRTVFIRIRRLL